MSKKITNIDGFKKMCDLFIIESTLQKHIFFLKEYKKYISIQFETIKKDSLYQEKYLEKQIVKLEQELKYVKSIIDKIYEHSSFDLICNEIMEYQKKCDNDFYYINYFYNINSCIYKITNKETNMKQNITETNYNNKVNDHCITNIQELLKYINYGDTLNIILLDPVLNNDLLNTIIDENGNLDIEQKITNSYLKREIKLDNIDILHELINYSDYNSFNMFLNHESYSILALEFIENIKKQKNEKLINFINDLPVLYKEVAYDFEKLKKKIDEKYPFSKTHDKFIFNNDYIINTERNKQNIKQTICEYRYEKFPQFLKDYILKECKDNILVTEFKEYFKKFTN